ncbi:MAG: recombinase RecA [Terracidiphilus sp.]|jgi:hypothetical protein
MPTAAALRLEIERALEHKFPAALTPAPRAIYEIAATGIAAVDELLGNGQPGGLPVGAISELTGAASSGRTSLALRFVAGRTAEGRACAWVDVDDALDPETAAANGVRLRQLLWVRCKSREQGSATPANKNYSPGTPAGIRDQKDRDRGNKGTREQGNEEARELGTRAWVARECARPSAPRTNIYSWGHQTAWARLDQGLRATDLLLQAGGFAGVVLDLGDTAPEQASRIPLATWFRYRQAAERTQCSLVVLGKRGYAQSAAAVVLECEARRAEAAGGTVLRGFEFAVRRGRERLAPIEITTRKPPVATWQANASWDAGRRA